MPVDRQRLYSTHGCYVEYNILEYSYVEYEKGNKKPLAPLEATRGFLPRVAGLLCPTILIGNPKIMRIGSISEPASGFHRAYPVLELLLRIDLLNLLFLRILRIRVDVVVRLVKSILPWHITFRAY